jgi:hypothetical protein
MQAEILAANPDSRIRIVGVNETGHQSGNEIVVADRTLPWLQDTALVGAWDAWEVTFRDVIVVDEQNREIVVMNLTTNDLGAPTIYAQLLGILREAAGETAE